MEEETREALASVWKLGGLTWRRLGKRVWNDIYEGDLFTRSAALSYYFLLALFPLLIFLTAALGYFAEAGTELRGNLLNYLASVAPRTASTLVRATVAEITENADTGKLSLGLLAALWFSSFGMAAVGDTLNAAYSVKESRAWWRVRLVSLGLTVALAVLIVSALALMFYGGEIGEGLAARLNLGDAFKAVWAVVQWPVVLAFVLFGFALIYYFAPDLKHQKWYWITPGSLTGVALWLLASFGFRVYLKYFDRYSVTYGSLGAVIVLLLWFYLTGAAILVGGAVNAEIEHAAARRGAPDAKLPGEKEPDESPS
jgi:membrane protein